MHICPSILFFQCIPPPALKHVHCPIQQLCRAGDITPINDKETESSSKGPRKRDGPRFRGWQELGRGIRPSSCQASGNNRTLGGPGGAGAWEGKLRQEPHVPLGGLDKGKQLS